MTHLIIAVSVLAFAEVITLTLFGKRACKKKNQSNLIIQVGKRVLLHITVLTVCQTIRFKRY